MIQAHKHFHAQAKLNSKEHAINEVVSGFEARFWETFVCHCPLARMMWLVLFGAGMLQLKPMPVTV